MPHNGRHRARFPIDPTVTLSDFFVQPSCHALGLYQNIFAKQAALLRRQDR